MNQNETDYDDLRDLVFKRLLEEINNGNMFFEGSHHKSRDLAKDQGCNLIYQAKYSELYSYEQLESLLKSLNEECSLPNGEVFPLGFDGDVCFECGEYSPKLVTDGVSIYHANQCEHPDGYPSYNFELDVPSGIMIVGSHLKNLFTAFDSNLDSMPTYHERSLDYSAIGLAVGHLGDKEAFIFSFKKENKDEFLIGAYGCLIDHDDDCELMADEKACQCEISHRKVPPIYAADELFEIESDCYYLMDYEDYKTKLAAIDNPFEPTELQLIHCKPGLYRFTHTAHRVPENPNRRSKPEIYCKINWVKNSYNKVEKQAMAFDSVVAEFEKKIKQHPGIPVSCTAGQVLLYHIRKYPHLFLRNNDEKCAESLFEAADHLMCVVGNGSIFIDDWIGCDKTESEIAKIKSIENIEIPFFDGQFDWYYLSTAYSKVMNVCYEDRKVNESFVKLSFNILMNCARFGSSSHWHQNDEKFKQLAEEALIVLQNKYPELVSKFCDEYLRAGLGIKGE